MNNLNLEITKDQTQDGVRFFLKGQIDSDNVSSLEKELDAALNEGKKNILLNMSRVDYLSSVGIRVIVKAYKAAKETGGNVSIELPSENVKKILVMTSLEEILVL